ncbi:MAG TPA: glycerophosphodiester phosphodiesterase [Feifaniaceae bacterium]|nr:glycerophosphodiester phosphodiesterase [Feifaniaceae bacterium]
MVKVIAHRGFSSRYPENSLLAFEKALSLGADGAEFDIQLTADGVPVVFHDESLLRITGNDLLIKDLTLEELRAFDISYKFRGQCPVQHIPTLEEYFELVKEHDFLNIIELKTAIYEYDGIEQKVIGLVRAHGLERCVVLSSFNHYSLLRCKAIAPELPCGILYECRIAEPQDYCNRLGMQYLHPDYRFLDDVELTKYESAGVKTSPWTVDHEGDMRYLLAQKNIFALMSNKPDLALSIRDHK